MNTKDFLAKIDIVQVVQKYVTLDKHGRNYQGLCPFHEDVNPSLVVSPDKQIYKCFSCNAGGNALKFVKEHLNLSYKQAIISLGKEFNIPVDIQEEKIDAKALEYYELNDEALKFFKYKLNNTSLAKTYLFNRGFNLSTIDKFKLGYIGDGEEFINLMLNKEYDPSNLILNSLAVEHNNKIFSFFNNRIIVPIFDANENCVAFSGRTLETNKESKEVKYLNSKETDHFKKSEILYNLNNAQSFITKENMCILVEGYMDVIALSQHNCNIALATMGTNLSANQITQIKNLTNNIILGFDSDQPGRNTTLKYAQILKKNGFTLFIFDYKEFKDADEYLKNTKDGYKTLVSNKQDFMQYYFELISKEINYKEISGQIKIISELSKMINNESISYLKMFAGLVSSKLNCSEEKVLNAFLEAKNLLSIQNTYFGPQEEPVKSNKVKFELNKNGFKNQFIAYISYVLRNNFKNLDNEIKDILFCLDESDIKICNSLMQYSECEDTFNYENFKYYNPQYANNKIILELAQNLQKIKNIGIQVNKKTIQESKYNFLKIYFEYFISWCQNQTKEIDDANLKKEIFDKTYEFKNEILKLNQNNLDECKKQYLFLKNLLLCE